MLDYGTLTVEESNIEYHVEKIEEYETETSKNKKKKDKKHDKIFKDILQSKEEMSKFISEYTKNRINSSELENYNVNYITKDFKYQQPDIVYKIKGKEIYYLIEHQTKVDYSMAYRILNYCVEIIRKIVENKEINRASYRYPIILPIVIYTGNQKWTAETSFASSYKKEKEFRYLPCETLDVNYRLIDVNKYSIEELLKQNTMFANAMILEKCQNKEEVITNLQKIIKNTKTKEQFENLKRLVIYLYSDMEENKIKEIVKLIKESECEEEMSTIAERFRKEYLNDMKKAVSEVIKNMLINNVSEEDIVKYTKFRKEDIEKIKRELATQKNN